MKSCCDEYCANHGCNQGRDCPVRKSACVHCHGLGYDASGLRCTCTETATRVARIGRKDYDRAPLPPSMWRYQIGLLGRWMLIVLALLLYAALISAVLR